MNARWIMAAALLLAANALAIDLRKAAASPAEWFSSEEGRRITESVLSHQTPIGGWAKAYSNESVRKEGESFGGWDGTATFDNGATITEMRFLAAVYNATQDQRARDAFLRGFDFLLKSQYENGGWPQRFPPGDDYGRYVTFNDNAMTNVMNLLLDVAEDDERFAFVDDDRRAAARAAFDRGVDYIVRSQIVVDGTPTGWCQQHDEKTYEPRPARSYELESISGSESTTIIMTLMRIRSPDARVINCIESAVAWVERAKIQNKSVATVPDELRPGKTRRTMVDDPNARPLWARFYDIETGRPFYCNRDGIKLFSFDQLDQERSMGYAWLGHWGEKVLNEYPKWKQRIASESGRRNPK